MSLVLGVVICEAEIGVVKGTDSSLTREMVPPIL